ncbi:MAG: SUMF1/EgtB/PvdO family nonheme iron enzyme [Cyanobacteria bacterium J06621_8]
MTKIALLIGVSQYQSDLNPLPKAVKDVEAMAHVLQIDALEGFEQVKTLADTDAQTMREEIEGIFSASQKDDLILLFFSGHGIKDDRGKLYFATNNTRKNDRGKLIRSTAVAAGFIQELMSQSRCKHQVVILDCCFSGAFAAGMTAKDSGNVDLQTQLGGEGRAVLTSSTSTQYSFEQEESDLSIYSRYIVEGIVTGAADLNSDGWIEVQELHEYAKAKVQATAPAMSPEIYAVKEGFKIRLAKALITDPKLKYRKEVERYASRGEIPAYVRIMLGTLGEQLGLSPTEAKAIEDEVLRPYRERLAHLQKYREAYAAATKSEYPLSQTTVDDLKHFQGMLGLRDEDIQPIEEEVINSRKTTPTREPRINQSSTQPRKEGRFLENTPARPRRNNVAPKGITRKQFLKWTGWGGGGLVATLVVSQIFKSPQNISVAEPKYIEPTQNGEIWTVEYETVTLNDKGEEISRDNYQTQFFKEDLGSGVILEMVSIPAGEFLIGSPSSEKYREANESPQHKVTVPAFFMGRFAVTQAQYQAVISSNPANFQGDNLPVERVSWNEAMNFCQKLSTKTGRNYRLPSEAEWEYACRAGTTTPFYFGTTLTTNLANYDGNYIYQSEPKGKYREKTTEVGSFPPNAFGLYDMHGNVWEWCLDYWHNNYQSALSNSQALLNKNDNRYRLMRGGLLVQQS